MSQLHLTIKIFFLIFWFFTLTIQNFAQFLVFIFVNFDTENENGPYRVYISNYDLLWANLDKYRKKKLSIRFLNEVIKSEKKTMNAEGE